jgi:hypothetical protein
MAEHAPNPRSASTRRKNVTMTGRKFMSAMGVRIARAAATDCKGR